MKSQTQRTALSKNNRITREKGHGFPDDIIWVSEELPDPFDYLYKRKEKSSFLDFCDSQVYVLIDINTKYLVNTP